METWWREIRDLDEDQRNVIGLPPDGSFLIKGPPGSGKTNLLLLRANYLAMSEHSNLAIIVFNRTLREFIRAGGSRYDFDQGRVVTIRQFSDALLDEAGESYDQSGTFEEIRIARLAAMERVFAPGRQAIYDVILLDEAQDYLAGEIEIFRRLSRDIFMVADSRQKIYAGDARPEHLTQHVNQVLTLRYHYRSGQPICDVADRIGATFSAGYDPIVPTCNYNSPEMQPSVEIFNGNLNAQIEEIARRLIIQRRAYPEALLGVICPRLSEVRALAEGLDRHGLGDDLCVQDREDGYQPISNEQPIWVSTVHSAKGLEFRALHFAAAEYVANFRAEQKRLAYTGVTRAKTALVVYHERPLPPYFDAALNAVRGRGVDIDLGAAFGRRE